MDLTGCMKIWIGQYGSERKLWGMNLTGRDLISDERLVEWLEGWTSRLEVSIPERCSVSSTFRWPCCSTGGPGGSKEHCTHVKKLPRDNGVSKTSPFDLTMVTGVLSPLFFLRH